jgi:hypothetical protein
VLHGPSPGFEQFETSSALPTELFTGSPWVQAVFDTLSTHTHLNRLPLTSTSDCSTTSQRQGGTYWWAPVLPIRVLRPNTSQVLNLLFVDPDYHRKVGAGRMMVEWGNRLADAMMLPCWVEASKQGRGLYASCGYEVAEQVQLETRHNTWDVADLSYPLMRRPIKDSVK